MALMVCCAGDAAAFNAQRGSGMRGALLASRTRGGLCGVRVDKGVLCKGGSRLVCLARAAGTAAATRLTSLVRCRRLCLATAGGKRPGLPGTPPRQRSHTPPPRPLQQLPRAVPPSSDEDALVAGLLARAKKLFDPRVPAFHTEYKERGAWPAGSNASACARMLDEAYTTAALQHKLNEDNDSECKVSAEDMGKRFGSTEPALLWWAESAPRGTVRDVANAALLDSYKSGRVWHSFSNAENRSVVLTPGTTHVSVGFVDLGILCAARFDEARALPGPLRWVGVEASTYAVAKTAVVDAMLRAGIATDAVLQVRTRKCARVCCCRCPSRPSRDARAPQVWYSAAWSRSTAAAFSVCVDELLESGGADNRYGAIKRNAEVESLLRTWRECEVPLAKAREQWLEGLRHNWSDRVSNNSDFHGTSGALMSNHTQKNCG